MAATAVVACTGFVGAGLSGSTAFGLPAPTPTASHDITVTKAGGNRLSVHAGSAIPRDTADRVAKVALSSGREIADEASGKVATTSLTTSLASLKDYRSLNPDTVLARVATTQHAAETVGAASIAADQRAAVALQAAQKKAAADRAAAQAKADAARQAAANTPAGAQATAKALMASQYGWGSDQYGCLVSLWSKESGWNYKAYNPSGATGIPQALPGSKMASVASDWSTNATTQVIWGLTYISGSYGTPCAAWSHSQSVNWY
ncbi:hypothetical protein GCM10025867_23520 [Frondihabitans sucicola]|uniref:Phospholipase n=2 Tax=Frondihabitans sucicola TaxID=1268041 RepID=A0ABN6XYU4_9MICO|nr:hypothetical protein GCM10025867_23520 [Frondihabitans sucicola]